MCTFSLLTPQKYEHLLTFWGILEINVPLTHDFHDLLIFKLQIANDTFYFFYPQIESKMKPLKAPVNLGYYVGSSTKKLDVPSQVLEIWEKWNSRQIFC